MPESGLVSVIIPCYNQAHFLDEAIESVLTQTYPNREIIVVDDGSTDNTAEVARRYSAVCYVYRENAGPAAARNAGVEAGRGKYLVFLDADDRLLPEALEIGVDCLRQHPECAFVSGHCRLIVTDGSLLAKPKQPSIKRDYYLEFLRRNYIWALSTVICQRTAFEIVKGFDTSLGRCEDYDLYLRITRDHPVFCHNQFVADYRLHNATRSVEHSLMLQDTLSALDGQWDFVKGSHRYTEALKIGKKYWRDRYRCLEIADRVPEIVEANLPSHATVAVATGGKNELLKLGGRRAWHFPQAGTNERGRLFQQGSEGSADVPWIEAGMRYEFHLFGGPEYSKELAALSVIGLADADLRINDIGSIPAGQAYLVAAPNPVPAPNRFGRTTITWNTGDGTEGRVYLSEGGAYDSSNPRDSDEAISHLEAIRARGAEYLLLPATAFWWLDRYQRFREYLEARCPVIVQDENICFIFDLVGTARARKIDRQTPIVVTDPDRTIQG